MKKKSRPGTVMIMTLVDAHNEQTALNKAVSDLKENHASNVDEKIASRAKLVNMGTKTHSFELMGDVGS